MQTVHITFRNLQSHEHTQFKLCPGINFILAKDNNVGKSTIFKVLTTVAMAPNVSTSRLNSIIRVGTNRASAEFVFNNERVTAFFIRETTGAPKLFFEHITSDGTSTRTVFCPKALLDALGIVVSEDEGVFNFNDADSVQLISKTSVEADKILTRVMTDTRVDTIKDNIGKLSTEMSRDSKMLAAQLESVEEITRELVYQEAVPEFFEHLEELYAACRVCDDAPVFSDTHGISEEDWNLMVSTFNVLSELEPCVSGLQSTDVDAPYEKEMEAAFTVLVTLSEVNAASLSKTFVEKIDLDKMNAVKNVMFRLQGASTAACELSTDTFKMNNKKAVLNSVEKRIRTCCRKVSCPVKGDVYYSPEECISVVD